jgi:hypothetical protein
VIARLVVGAGLLLAVVGCNGAPPLGSCNSAAAEDAGPVSSLNILFGSQAPSSNGDGGVHIPLRVTASIPCLAGSVSVDLSAAAGSLNGFRPGVDVTLLLVPDGADGGLVEGLAAVDLPLGTQTRVTASLDQASASISLSASEDGGVTLSPSTSL